jgi:predicted hotdog family 3-hydroxylacyl-ACP dehydratase
VPELGVRRWHDPTIAAFVHVEEAPMDEDRHLAAWHHNIGLARQIIPVQAVPEAHLTEQSAHHDFRLGIFVPDRSHVVAALFWSVDIDHQASLCFTSCTNPFTSRIVIGLPLGYCL